MHPVSLRRAHGFTMGETLITLSIIGILAAVAAPSFKSWLIDSRVRSASEFYLSGFRTARLEAIKHNSASRLVLTENAASGQYDWQVDICYPSSNVDCRTSTTAWSTVTANAPGDPELGAGFKSRVGNAEKLLKAPAMDQHLEPPGVTTIQYLPNGWVDNSVPRLRLLTLVPPTPLPGKQPDFPQLAVAVTLAGVATICRPDITTDQTDSRRCP